MTRLAIFTDGRFQDVRAKIAHGVLRFGGRDVVAIIDGAFAGRLANEVVPHTNRPTPIVGTVAEARKLGANRLLIGVVRAGGKLQETWRALLLEAITLGMDLEAGMHTLLGDDPELAAAARFHGVEIHDLRAEPPGLDLPLGPAQRVPARIVHSVGTDSRIGKMSVTLELDRAARSRGLASVFVATGQAGIAISGWGIAVDHVISDYVAGATDRIVREGAARGDLLWVEGQGSLYHPGFSGVTLGLLHGALPDALVLCHQVGSANIGLYPETPIPPLPEVIRAYEAAAGWLRPAPVVAIALHTGGLDQEAARAAIEETEAMTGLVADDVVRFGPDRLLDTILAALAAPT